MLAQTPDDFSMYRRTVVAGIVLLVGIVAIIVTCAPGSDRETERDRRQESLPSRTIVIPRDEGRSSLEINDLERLCSELRRGADEAFGRMLQAARLGRPALVERAHFLLAAGHDYEPPAESGSSKRSELASLSQESSFKDRLGRIPWVEQSGGTFRVRDFVGQSLWSNGEAHHGQLLCYLASVEGAADLRIVVSDDRTMSLNELADGAVESAGEIHEPEFLVVGLIAFSDVSEWTSRFEGRVTLDDLVLRVVNADSNQASCFGAHQCEALLAASLVGSPRISDSVATEARRCLDARRRQAVNALSDYVHNDWIDCPSSRAPEAEQLNWLGHTLAWLALCCTDDTLRQDIFPTACRRMLSLLARSQGGENLTVRAHAIHAIRVIEQRYSAMLKTASLLSSD